MSREPKLTNTTPNFWRPAKSQNPVSSVKYFFRFQINLKISRLVETKVNNHSYRNYK